MEEDIDFDEMEEDIDFDAMEMEDIEALTVPSVPSPEVGDVDADAEKDHEARIQSAIEADPAAFSLVEPHTLTVKRADGGFSKKAHIGAEDFRVVGAYMGKRKTMIFQFKPLETEPYELMEMGEQDARLLLRGFDYYLNTSLKEAMAPITHERKEAAKAEAAKANEPLFERYKDIGYGTF